MRFLVFFLFSVLLISSFISAAPVQVSGLNGLEISYPAHQFIKPGETLNFDFHVDSKENGVALTSADVFYCEFHVYDTGGNNIMNERKNNTDIIDTYDLEFSPNTNNFTTTGVYYYDIYCECATCGSGGIVLGGFDKVELDVTPDGMSGDREIIIVTFNILFIILFAFMLISLLTNIATFAELNTDASDVIKSMVSYFALILYYYLALAYFPADLILNLSLILIRVSWLTHVFLPMIALAVSLTVGNLRKQEGN